MHSGVGLTCWQAGAQPFEPALPALLRRAGSQDELRCSAIQE